MRGFFGKCDQIHKNFFYGVVFQGLYQNKKGREYTFSSMHDLTILYVLRFGSFRK